MAVLLKDSVFPRRVRLGFFFHEVLVIGVWGFVELRPYSGREFRSHCGRGVSFVEGGEHSAFRKWGCFAGILGLLIIACRNGGLVVSVVLDNYVVV